MDRNWLSSRCPGAQRELVRGEQREPLLSIASRIDFKVPYRLSRYPGAMEVALDVSTRCTGLEMAKRNSKFFIKSMREIVYVSGHPCDLPPPPRSPRSQRTYRERERNG